MSQPLSRLTNDQLVEHGNEALLSRDDRRVKQIEFEMWRRDAEANRRAQRRSSDAANNAFLLAILAITLLIGQLLGLNTVGGWVFVAVMTLAVLFALSWRVFRRQT